MGHGAGRQGRLDLIFFGVFFALLWLNLFLADRSAPQTRVLAGGGTPRPLHDLVAGRSRLVRAVVSFFFALLAAAGVQSQWEEWLLFVNRQDFGITDPQFGTDIGFYLFQCRS